MKEKIHQSKLRNCCENLNPPYQKGFQGDVYTLDGFRKLVRDGLFTEYDGMAEYATKEGEYFEVICALEDFSDIQTDMGDYVIWYNK